MSIVVQLYQLRWTLIDIGNYQRHSACAYAYTWTSETCKALQNTVIVCVKLVFSLILSFFLEVYSATKTIPYKTTNSPSSNHIYPMPIFQFDPLHIIYPHSYSLSRGTFHTGFFSIKAFSNDFGSSLHALPRVIYFFDCHYDLLVLYSFYSLFFIVSSLLKYH